MPATSTFWQKHSLAEDANWTATILDARPNERSTTRITSALENLVRYYNLCPVSTHFETESHAAFQHRTTAALATWREQIVSFFIETLGLAEAARDDDQFEVSWRRSAIQLLLDEYPSVLAGIAPPTDAFLAEEIELIDDELRRMGASYGRLPEHLLPDGLPRTHWWWWPDPIPGYKRWEP